jgi:alkylhydroperoxidase family enzyme
MGADSFIFVQVLFVSDVFSRARIALGRLFDEPYLIGPGSDDDHDTGLWTLLERFMQQVALVHNLDPLTTELVRLRGARVHNCRLCQSRLSVRALDAAGAASVFDELDDYEHASFTEAQVVALRLTDALVTQPSSIDAAMAVAVREQFSTAEIVEIVLDVVRNAANKIAVAFGADAPVVSEGVEYYDIDAHGDVVADVDREVVRAATL